MRLIDVSFNWITGAMLGFEYVQDEGDQCIVIDLLILRVLICWGEI
jgi:hypothetical protein